MHVAILCANGQYHPEDASWFPRLPQKALRIAVDGGAQWLFLHRYPPHVYVGDQDSLTPQVQAWLKGNQVRFLTFPEDKDQTDLELALHFAYQQGAREFHLFGALGGRWDQTLANLFLPLQPAFENATFCYYADGHRLILFQGEYHLEGEPGDVVTLVPFCQPAQEVTLQGLHWPLHGETLPPGTTRGVSNRMVQSQAHVHLRRGRLWLIHLPRQVHRQIEQIKTGR